MAITSAEIHNQSFSIDRKGYDVDEVDVFLEHVADEIDILNDTIAHLQDQLEADRFSGFDAPAASTVAITEVAAATVDTSEYDAQLAQKDAIIADLERQLSDKRADDNAIAQALVRENQHLTGGTVEGLYAFPHPFGCSQMGEDHALTRKLLAALARHPNAGGVLVLGLGCENLTMEQFQAELGPHDKNRVRFLVCQDVEDELAAGAALLKELADYAGTFRREPISASELVVGLKCGGSDGLSGITANPAVGRFSDRLIALGGSTVLTEVPEMFGAESILFDRCKDEAVFDKAVQMVEAFKRYFIRHGQVVYENPSPGNKAGGITTLEDKSCGCVQKGGSARIVDVLGYGEAVTRRGLNLLSGPGNDLVSTTALTAAGAHLILFTTGRGTPFGAPAPTVKISSNTALFQKKGSWIDFNAGTVAEGETLDAVGDRLLDLVLEAASGSPTKTELHGAREIAIFKDGVVL